MLPERLLNDRSRQQQLPRSNTTGVRPVAQKCGQVAVSSAKQARVLKRGQPSRKSASAPRFVWAACTIALCSCASGAPRETSPLPRPRRDSAALRHDPAQLRGSSWRRIELPRFSLVVPLPEFAEWSIDDTTERWFVARHAGSSSELRLRAWSANRSVTPEQCETQARLWLRAAPVPADDDAVEVRRLRAPTGYHGQLIAGVRLIDAGSELEGYALAFGAAVGRCYAAVFTTRGRGPRAEERVGATLAVVAGGMLERVEVGEVEDRAPRPEFPF